MMSEDQFKELRCHIDELIGQGGWAVLLGCTCGKDEVPFAFTIGLHSQGRSELVMSMPSVPQLHEFLNHVGGYMNAKKISAFDPGVPNADIATGPTLFLDVVDQELIAARFPQIAKYYEDVDPNEIRLQQVVWSDTHGHFPTDQKSEFNVGEYFHGAQVLFGVSMLLA